MKRQSQAISPLPNVAYGGNVEDPAAGSCSTPIDVSSGFHGFAVQLVGVTASSGQTVAVDGSLDEGETWVEITSSMVDLGSAAAAVTSPITTDGIYALPYVFPGSVRMRCVAHGSGTPGVGHLNFQDSRQV